MSTPERGLSLLTKFVEKYGRLPTEFDTDYLEMLQMSKYRIVPQPDVKMAKCANCGSAKNDGRGYVDFGLQIDWHGAVFLCTLCLEDIATAAGLFKVYEEKLARVQESAINSEVLFAQGVALKDSVLHIFEEVKSYLNIVYPPGDDVSSDSNPDLDSNKATSKSSTTRTESRASKTESGTTKSATGTGSKNLPSLGELLNLKD